MRPKSILVLIMTTLLLGASCSNNEKKKDELISESGDGQQDQVLQDADFIVDADESDLLLEDDMSTEDEALLEEELSDVQPQDQGQQDLFAQEEMAAAEEEDSQMVESQRVQPAIDESAPVKEYTVKEGETLLWVAFKLYGDYEKWKEVSEMNGGIKQIDEGQVLSYKAPAEPFEWSPEGVPHMIKKGETLGTISQDKYGTSQRWKDIYENNQPMIKDPNLIFAGFTLYYVPDDRGVASE
mgnify:CR=1 FL=1